MQNIEIKKLPESVVELKGEISAAEFERYRPSAVKNISEQTEIPGFRKGKVPEQILIQKLGEEKILYEMAELALDAIFPELLREHNLDAVGRPNVSITKIAAKNPLGFSITVSVIPEIVLPDYKHIAENINKEKEDAPEINEKEVSDAIENIRKQVAHQEGMKNGNDEKTQDLPEFNDDFVKKLGNYKDVAEFREKLKEHLIEEKKLRAKEKKRVRIMDEVLKKTPFELPRIIIEGELDKMTAQFKGDIARMGATFEDYLKHTKKTEEDMRKEWTNDAKKRASLELILHKIGMEEHITPSQEEVSKEVDHILKHHKDADPERARMYVTGILTNEKVLQFLEEGR